MDAFNVIEIQIVPCVLPSYWLMRFTAIQWGGATFEIYTDRHLCIINFIQQRGVHAPSPGRAIMWKSVDLKLKLAKKKPVYEPNFTHGDSLVLSGASWGKTFEEKEEQLTVLSLSHTQLSKVDRHRVWLFLFVKNKSQINCLSKPLERAPIVVIKGYPFT